MCTVFLNCVEVEREGDIKEVGRGAAERRGEWRGKEGGAEKGRNEGASS